MRFLFFWGSLSGGLETVLSMPGTSGLSVDMVVFPVSSYYSYGGLLTG